MREPPLDAFLRTLVGQYETGSFDVSCLPEAIRKELPKHSIPTIHLGRLAVDLSFRGKRLGESFLFHALHTALELSEKRGAFAVDVWAIDDEAGVFYRKYGFIPLTYDPLHFYVPMKTIAAMFEP